MTKRRQSVLGRPSCKSCRVGEFECSKRARAAAAGRKPVGDARRGAGTPRMSAILEIAARAFFDRRGDQHFPTKGLLKTNQILTTTPTELPSIYETP